MDTTQPPTRWADHPGVPAEKILAIATWMKKCHANGWNPMEFVYDMNNTVGATAHELGFHVSNLELVALIFLSLDKERSDGHAPAPAVDGPERADRVGDQPQGQGVGMEARP